MVLADQDWYCPTDACQLLKQQRNNQNISDAENEISNCTLTTVIESFRICAG